MEGQGKWEFEEFIAAAKKKSIAVSTRYIKLPPHLSTHHAVRVTDGQRIRFLLLSGKDLEGLVKRYGNKISFHEMIQEHNVNLFADIDIVTQTEIPESDMVAEIISAVEAFSKFSKEKYGSEVVTFRGNDVAICKASRPILVDGEKCFKNSFHFVYPGLVFKNRKTLKLMMATAIKENLHPLCGKIDQSVYNSTQSLRMIHCVNQKTSKTSKNTQMDLLASKLLPVYPENADFVDFMVNSMII